MSSLDKHLLKTVDGHLLIDWINHGEICADCGTPFVKGHYLQDTCTDCLESYEPRNYSYRVEQDLGFEPTKETRFGIELEYEEVTGRQVMKTLRGHALPKRDGSIDYGVEIVTRPASIKTHKEKLEKFFKEVAVQARSNTGMHVHVEKAKLSQYQIGFIMQFLNTKELTKYTHVIAGREYSTNHYTALHKEHTMTYGISFEGYGRPLSRMPTDKYSALNTNKQHTVEFRIFSSPESHLECCAKLDFVNALVKYSSPYSVSVKNLKEKFSWPLFLSFIEKNRKEFIDFHNYFIKSGKLQEVNL